MKKRLIVLALIMVTAFALTSCEEELHRTVKWAGVRVSSYGMVRKEYTDKKTGKKVVKNQYAFSEFPDVSKMASFGNKMASCYDGSTGAYILIVGTMGDEDACHLHFKVKGNYDCIYGDDDDFYEDYLDKLDELGYSVWLQVEPGYADLVTLADIVMKQYGHHTCVKGFGIDVEWHKPIEGSDEGTKLSDSVAKKVLAKVREYNSSYTVFVKHWMQEQLPSKMEGLIYVNDSQQFGSMREVLDDFSDWASYYAPQPVMFQIGYEADRWIWNEYDNPAKEFGQAIADACTSSNDIGIIWVDFTLADVINKTSK